jgi:hypothetical protein
MAAIRLILLVSAVLLLAACGSGAIAPLALAQDKSTFVFFYTDN